MRKAVSCRQDCTVSDISLAFQPMVDRKFSVAMTIWEVISISAIKRPRELKFGMKILRGQNNHFHKRLLGKFLLSWQ